MESASKYIDMNDDEEEELDFAETDMIVNDIDDADLNLNVNNNNNNPSPVNAPLNNNSPAPQAQPTGFFGGLLSSVTNTFSAPPPPSSNINAPGVTSPFRFGSVMTNNNNNNVNRKKRAVRKVNTNILAVELGTLTKDVVFYTGDPCYCKSCSAAFSHLDTNRLKEQMQTDEKAESKNWLCTFCDNTNEFDLQDEEQPKEESIDYILEPAPTQSSSTSTADTLKPIIFVIDISGSMCVTQEVAGRHTLKGNASGKSAAAFNTDRSSQHYGGSQNKNVTYVSRLQSVQAAVTSQIETFFKEQPNRKIGLITFNNEVTIYGDCSSKQGPVTVTGDKLNSFTDLFDIGKSHPLTAPISSSSKVLNSTLFNLEECGATALGPALTCAVGMASLEPGTEVVVCTDGVANVGIGALDAKKKDGEEVATDDFYASIGECAKSKGVVISVISIKGDDCRLEKLGIVTDATTGAINIVDPLNILNEFKEILSLPIIATNCSVKLLLHKGLYIRKLGEEEEKQEDKNAQQNSAVNKEIGNVTSESVFTVEYGVRSEFSQAMKKQVMEGVQQAVEKMLPFQLQITYTKLNGMKCVRIISKEQAMTWDKTKTEENAQIDVLGLHAQRTTATIAQKGGYTDARLHNAMYTGMMNRAATNNNNSDVNAKQKASVWSKKAQKVETQLQQVQVTEQQQGLFYDDDEMSSADRNKARSSKRDDATANMLYQMKSNRKK